MTELPITEVHSCRCGCSDNADLPELDTRTIPHALRHGAVFGALATLRPGQGLVLIASHDPKPLVAQIAEGTDGAIAVSYLVEGPEAWHLRMIRR
ncbi:MAG TPA: DUF2249 domain-containing protein [Flexivirga sp.]|uniref:DUF2249 domain-containing protein n=1 Tax=Flexivirga sp. TaxID=1962927 RepID=UPI002B686542|nr:DUF2249 domain-containing protein [Flexivirga sp.]HWC21409.1 DUF2249 domain-containing protein [Flexivirga sp.]